MSTSARASHSLAIPEPAGTVVREVAYAAQRARLARIGAPPSGSTQTTCAPRSPRSFAACAPARDPAISTTTTSRSEREADDVIVVVYRPHDRGDKSDRDPVAAGAS